MIAEHGATVLPFSDALLRAPKDRNSQRPGSDRSPIDGPLPDNVVVLARFARARRARRHQWLGGPPEGEAA